MADAAITISNGLNVHGIAPSNVWGTMTWNQKWGSGDLGLPVTVEKFLAMETLTMDLVESHDVTFIKTFSHTLSVAGDLSNEGLSDAAGYNKLADGSANFENRVFTSYSEAAEPTTTFTEVPRPGTTWSES